MTFTCLARLMLGAALCAAVGCSDAPRRIETIVDPNGSLAFGGPSLELAPGDVVDIRLSSSGDVSRVALSLDGEYGDSSLEAAFVTPADGQSVVRLHAAKSPANFYLSASAAGVNSARLYIGVSASGFASIRVKPNYMGKRGAAFIVASAFLKDTCAELAALPPKDGAPVVVGASGDMLLLQPVPAGVHVAVAVRISGYATGCVDLDALAPGSARDAFVAVYDRPIDLSQTDLTANFTFAPDPAEAVAWAGAAAAAATLALDAISVSDAAEPAAVLDAMSELTPNMAAKQAFVAARAGAQWDATVGAWLTGHGGLRSHAATWLAKGASLTNGPLGARILSSGVDGEAIVAPQRLGIFAAAEVGLNAAAPFTWVADADDTLRLHGTVTFSPTRLATAGADVIAAGVVPSAVDGASALALALDCTGLGQKLAQGGYSYGACDAACTASLCEGALQRLWKAARNRSEQLAQEASVGITATVHGTLTDNAQPVAFSGDWVGPITASGVTFGSRGTASATATAK